MFRMFVRALTLAALWISAVNASLAATPEEALFRVEQTAERAYQAALLLRQATTLDTFEMRLAHAKSCAAALSVECQALTRLMPDDPDDLRFEPNHWRQTADALLTNARFAELALYDLERAIRAEDHRLRTRALRELAGGLRFVRLEASELAHTERKVDWETGWDL